jgi:TonB family protein
MCVAATAATLSVRELAAEPRPRSSSQEGSSAVDVNGVRHWLRDYGEGGAPWFADIVKRVQPDYPAQERARRTGGTGVFQVTVDVSTGSVLTVSVLKSTGSAALDESAMRAIRLWRWRPRRWKEVDIPVHFTMRPPQGGSDLELAAQRTAYYCKGDNENAIKTSDEILRRQPASASAYVDRGCAYQEKGQYDRALADFNQAIGLDPKYARAYCDRAILDDLLRQPDKASKDFNEAIRLAPDYWRAYFNRGWDFLGQHNYERAIADYTRAIQLKPNDLGSYSSRAYAYAKQGDRKRAFADAMVATKLKPSEMYLWRPIDLALRARAYNIIGQPELALRDVREGARLSPNNAAANNSLAWFLATSPEQSVRNGTEAVSAATKACDISRWKESDHIDTLAVAYAEVGDFDQAIKFERQSLADASLSPKQREEREKHLSLFQQRKPFRDDPFHHEF